MVQCDVPLQHGGDSTVKRLAEWYFPRRTHPIEKYKLARQCVWSATRMMKKREAVYYCLECDVALSIHQCVFQGLPYNEILLG